MFVVAAAWLMAGFRGGLPTRDDAGQSLRIQPATVPAEAGNLALFQQVGSVEYGHVVEAFVRRTWSVVSLVSMLVCCCREAKRSGARRYCAAGASNATFNGVMPLSRTGAVA